MLISFQSIHQGCCHVLRNVQLTFKSKLAVPAEQSWQWAISVDGISTELRPLLKMTVPHHVKSLLGLEVRLGQRLFRSWLLLFGVIPIDRSDLTLVELDPGRRFIEQSPMLSMRLWRHERIVRAVVGGSTITDRLEFQPRFNKRLTRWFIKKLFTHRHAVLRRSLG